MTAPTRYLPSYRQTPSYDAKENATLLQQETPSYRQTPPYDSKEHATLLRQAKVRIGELERTVTALKADLEAIRNAYGELGVRCRELEDDREYYKAAVEIQVNEQRQAAGNLGFILLSPRCYAWVKSWLPDGHFAFCRRRNGDRCCVLRLRGGDVQVRRIASEDDKLSIITALRRVECIYVRATAQQTAVVMV